MGISDKVKEYLIESLPYGATARDRQHASQVQKNLNSKNHIVHFKDKQSAQDFSNKEECTKQSCIIKKHADDHHTVEVSSKYHDKPNVEKQAKSIKVFLISIR